ncbi:MAG: nuclear transport factor 2 family protein [Sphingomonadales bacterium]|nr:MAG: nuclear transport factor 2 family protein [Sphingomonadales bacterium]
MTDFLAAERGVRQLQARYVDAVWRKDFEAFGDCFTEDGEWWIAGQHLQGRAQCRGLLEKVMPAIERVYMTFGTPILELRDGAAIARTYVTEMNASKGKPAIFAIGIYYDRCVEQDGRWRFAWHHYQSYYHGPGDLSGLFRPMNDYGAPFGMPAPDEPSPAAGSGNI